MRLCVIGCGNVGRIIARAVDEGTLEVDLKYYDRNPKKCEELGKPYSKGFEEFLEGCDVVLEAASPQAVKEFGAKVLERADLIVLSVGALLDEELLRELLEVAERNDKRIFVPSGAIAGLDAIKALSLVGIDEVTLVTTKNPKALGVEAKERKVLFEGDAKEAVKRFPFNVNVVAALSLAAKRLAKVKIVADPNVDKNVHEVYVKSKASDLYIKVENVPSPMNPKTSYLAALSVIELIKEIGERLRVGT